MGDWSLLRANLATEDDTALATYAATITASGSANTKGSYTQLVASLSRSCIGVILQLRGNSAAYVLFDLAIGAGGSEQVVVPNISGSVSLASNGMLGLFIPLSLPAGTRVAARCQAGSGSQTILIKAQFISDHFAGMQTQITRWVNWGADTSVSRGTTLTSGNLSDVKGSWVQLSAAADLTTKWILIMVQAIQTVRNHAIDIGIGAAASEQVVLSNLFFDNSALGMFLLLPFSIPAGQRIAARNASGTQFSTVTVMILGGG